jgi:hypothetical protein
MCILEASNNNQPSPPAVAAAVSHKELNIEREKFS